MEQQPREKFGSSFGMLMALAGSAVGLGNLWRFPYMVGAYGGAAFLVVYVLFALLLCMPIFFAEMIVGRRGQANVYRTFKKLAPHSPWKWLGLLMVITPTIVVSYYSVIGGWSVEYLLKAIQLEYSTQDPTELKTIFNTFVSSPWRPLIELTIFLGLTAYVVMRGVKGGIEKFGKLMMPMLFFIVIAITLFSAMLPGAKAGYEYLFKPDFSKVTGEVCLAALGQAFFSLSLGFGTMMTYASYVDKKKNICKYSGYTAVMDFLFAVIASCAIMPAVYSFGVEPGAGPGLVFETLPMIFSKMPAGGFVAILFFVALLVAALTSSVSIFEVGVAYLVEELNVKRRNAVLIAFVITWTIGALCSLSFGPLAKYTIMGHNFFDVLDLTSANLLMTLGALFLVIFVGWKMKKSDVYDEFTNGGTLASGRKVFPSTYFIIKYVCPIAILIILITSFVK